VGRTGRAGRAGSALTDGFLLNLVLEVAGLGEGRGGPEMVEWRLRRRNKDIGAEQSSLGFEVAIGGGSTPESRPVHVRAGDEHLVRSTRRARRGARGAELVCSAQRVAVAGEGRGRCRADGCVHVHGVV
jgi:hypothetical protein